MMGITSSPKIIHPLIGGHLPVPGIGARIASIGSCLALDSDETIYM